MTNLGDLANEALEGELADEELRRLLVAADLTESDGSRPARGRRETHVERKEAAQRECGRRRKMLWSGLRVLWSASIAALGHQVSSSGSRHTHDGLLARVCHLGQLFAAAEEDADAILDE